MNQKIFPRNLTARGAVTMTGNPVTIRLESGVGNPFSGLEFDHPNLDRRFSSGLIFNFGVTPPVLASTDDGDPALAVPADHGILCDLADAYRRGDVENAGKMLSARQQMMALDQAAEQLPANGIGIPFF
jgi:hypothetical protein